MSAVFIQSESLSNTVCDLQTRVISSANKFLDKLVLSVYNILNTEVVLFYRVDPKTGDYIVTNAYKGADAIGKIVARGCGIEGF